ncbi:MAG TPA: cob(I)yrinic acid a,c-diamide adenosyltransferase [Deltaproteobacteria bacterium]|nr:cob(I)yrinic acid a,c-diamide adenosyltransferase [Deltaproteobacteria bacterium]
MKKGLLIVNTGNSKGKTTAAFGQALRSAGQGLKVCIIQFIKGHDQTGEAKAVRAHLAENIELHITGSGFTWQQDQQRVQEAADQGWQLARAKISSDAYDMIVLDEFTYLLSYQLIDENQALDFIKNRPPRLHIVITGRNAGPGLIEAADLVTEMREIKHHYRQGVKAQKGIEF